MDEDEELFAAELAKHGYKYGVRDLCAHCMCGWVSDENAGPDAHRIHIAHELVKVGFVSLDRARAAERKYLARTINEQLDALESSMDGWGACRHEWNALDKVRSVLKEVGSETEAPADETT